CGSSPFVPPPLVSPLPLVPPPFVSPEPLSPPPLPSPDPLSPPPFGFFPSPEPLSPWSPFSQRWSLASFESQSPLPPLCESSSLPPLSPLSRSCSLRCCSSLMRRSSSSRCSRIFPSPLPASLTPSFDTGLIVLPFGGSACAVTHQLINPNARSAGQTRLRI